MMDTVGDGEIDTILADNNGDNIPDIVLRDNGKGVFEPIARLRNPNLQDG